MSIVLGPDEIQSGTVTVKQMKSGDQETVKRDELLPYLQKILRASG
jgi:histidyl-tRNA synthetase